MPVPDSFNLYKDFQGCEICGKAYTDDKFVRVMVDNDKDGVEKEKRICCICIYCREKCRTDPAFEKATTEKVFNQKLGRRIKIIT